MATAEATNELLYSLDHDPIRWKRTDGVPVFRPHERKIGDQTIKVTAADLGKIAEKANNDIAESGKLPTFTLGHRKFGAVDESEQPELLGFYKNFRVTEITRNGQKFPALVADEYAAADQVEKHGIYRKFPFRSGEYHPDLGFTGVAALQQEPWLKFGTNFEYRGGSPPINYQAEAPKMADQATQTPDTDDVDPGMYAAWMKCQAKYMASIGGANGGTPAPVSNGDKPAQYQLVYDPQFRTLREENEAIKKKLLSADCEKMLAPLVGLYQFDTAKEVSRMATYQTDAERTEHLKYIEANYAKLPGGTPIQLYHGGVVPQGLPQGKPVDDPHVPTPTHDQVMTYMRANPGMDYDTAERKVMYSDKK